MEVVDIITLQQQKDFAMCRFPAGNASVVVECSVMTNQLGVYKRAYRLLLVDMLSYLCI